MSERRHIGYICYNQADEHYQRELQKHLTYYKDQRQIFYWDKTQIQPGQNPQEVQADALARAGVAILLISADFFADPTIMNDELPALLEAARQQLLTLFILLVSPCAALDDHELHQYQPFNTVPLRSQPEAQQQEALADLARSVAHVLAPTVVTPPLHSSQSKQLPATGQRFLSPQERHRLYEIIEAKIDGASTRNIRTFLIDHQVPSDIAGRVNLHQGSLDIAQEIVALLEQRGELARNFHALGSFLHSLLKEDSDNYALGVELTSLIVRHALILDQATLKHLGDLFQLPPEW